MIRALSGKNIMVLGRLHGEFSRFETLSRPRCYDRRGHATDARIDEWLIS